MNIKRCVQCGKPLRADAAYCKACGHTMGGEGAQVSIAGGADAIHRPPTAHSTRQTGRDLSRPHRPSAPSRNRGTQPSTHSAQQSTPPASPHRAGHYSGLHPEDQPYQSSFMAVLRPPTPVILSPSLPPTSSNPKAIWTPKAAQAAPDHLSLEDDQEQEEPDEPISPPSPLFASSNPNAIWMPKAAPHQRTEHPSKRTPAQDNPAASPLPPSLQSPTGEHVEAEVDGRRMGGLLRMPLVLARSRFSTAPGRGDIQAFPPPMHRTPRMQERAVPMLLTISCILFLVATSLLAYAFLSQRHVPGTSPTLVAIPNSGLRATDSFTLTGTGFGINDLITFSRDTNIVILDSNQKPLQALADTTGNFTVKITISSRWGAGQHTIHATDDAQRLAASTQITIEAPSAAPPRLQLSSPHNTIDFGAGEPGQVSRQYIILTNAGGGTVSWQAHSSDPNWLIVTPTSGTFSGRGSVTLLVNRSTQPGPHTGYVTFTQQGGPAVSLTLAVSMSINAPKASQAFLVLSTASLSYTGSTTQNPPTQTMIMLNSGGQSLNWSATATTGNGMPWLSLTPSAGILPPHTATLVTVSIQSQQLAPGFYAGTISFQGGVNPQVSVALTIVAPAHLAIVTPSLALQAAQGHESNGQITIQNSGGQPLDWNVSAGASWLSASPVRGHLAPAETQSITVTAHAASLAASTYSGTLTFTSGPSRTQVTVNLMVSIPPMPGISVQPSSLVFNTTQGINPAPRTFTITNIGNAPLNWATSEDANGTMYAATSSSSSTSSLASSKSVTITVTPKVASAGPGQITALITVFDSDAGSTVPKQQVTVTINISSAAVITALPTDMSFNEGSGVPSKQELLFIENTGSAPLDWSLAQGTQTPVPWLSFDTASGTVVPGAAVTVNVTCDSSQLSAGTYTATLVVSDSDPNSPVLPQTVTVTLVVS